LNDHLKPIVFHGTSLEDLRSTADAAMQRIGYQLHRLQQGLEPQNWKPMKTIGPGVNEIRVSCNDGAFRVFYVVNRPEAIYVLHVFRKTTQKTEKRDIDLAFLRFKEIGD
jgi:phage-related protein